VVTAAGVRVAVVELDPSLPLVLDTDGRISLALRDGG